MRLLSAIVLAGSVACASKSTTYVGSAMSEASPDSAAALSLTLWPSSDTSFTGYLRAGPPVNQTGWAYAWYESGALEVLAISGDQDTTLWSTRTTDASLGGRFIVRGGPGAGGGGTWRAELRQGPPATVATLRARKDGSLLDDLFPGLFMIGGVVAAALWIRRQPEPPLPQPPPYAAFASVASGVSGWLLLFTIAEIAGMVATLGRSGTMFQSYKLNPLWHIGGTAAVFHPLIRFEQVFHLAKIVGPLIGVTLIVRRSRFAPRFWIAYLAWVFACVAVDVVGAQLVNLGVERELGTEVGGAIRRDGSNAVWMNLRAMFLALVWGAYWSRSVRIRATFGSGGLDRGIVATVAAANEPQPAEMTEAGP